MTNEEKDALAKKISDDFFREFDAQLGDAGICYMIAIGRGPGDFQIATNVRSESLRPLLALIHESVHAYLVERENGGPPPDMPAAQ